MTSEDRWSTTEDERVRSALASLRDDVTAVPLPEPAFVRSRGDRRRRRRVLATAAGVAAAAVAVAAVGFGVIGRGDDNAQPPPVPASRSTAPATDASPSPTATGPGSAGFTAYLAIPSAMPIAQEWRTLVRGGTRTPVVEAQPSHEMAGLGCLTPAGATLREDQRVVGDPANPDATLLGTQNRWTFATPARARAARTTMAAQLRTQCRLPGLAETPSGDAAGTGLWSFDAPDGAARIALVTAGRDVALVEVVPAAGPIGGSAFTEFATAVVHGRLVRYGTAQEPVVVGPTGATPPASLFVPVSSWADALGLRQAVTSATGELNGTSDVAQCDADGSLFRAANGTANGTFGVAQIRVPDGFVGRQRVRRIDAASAPEGAASVNAYLATLRSGFLAGCTFPNGEVTAEPGPTDGVIKATTTFADGSPSLTTYLGVGPLGTDGYATTIALFNLTDLGDADAFAAVQTLLDVAAHQ